MTVAPPKRVERRHVTRVRAPCGAPARPAPLQRALEFSAREGLGDLTKRGPRHSSQRPYHRDMDHIGFRSSVVSYPTRGAFGRNDYRGNTTGFIVRDFLSTYHGKKDGLFVDPAEGGGTSRDVAKAMNVPYEGLDLRTGFNLLRDDLVARLSQPAQSVWFHPPYAGMVRYSGHVWGNSGHDDDLSAAGEDIPLFLEMLQAALQNIYRALAPGGHYGVLLGSWRKNGRYHHLPALMLPVAPGALVGEVIKVQHNCTSDRTAYSGSFVRIAHETLLVFRREQDGTTFAMALEALDRLRPYARATWRNVVRSAFRNGDALTLADLYSRIESHPNTHTNPTWRATLRRVVQDEHTFERIARGTYRLAA